jgi:hypothetical protein
MNRRRATTGWMMWAVLIAALILGIGRFWAWRYGGVVSHHRLTLLRPGMSRGEVEKIVGPPTHKDEHVWIITRPGSAYWLEIYFDSLTNRFCGFREDCF